MVATEEDKVPPTEKEIPARSDGIHLALADCIAESLEGLCLSEEDEQVFPSDLVSAKLSNVDATLLALILMYTYQ